MARIRTIKPEFWTDEAVGECSVSARLLLIASLNFADDYGGLDRSAKQLKAQAFPYDNIDCEPLVQELIRHGLFVEYEVDGRKYLHIKGFRKHQKVEKPAKPRIPIYEASTNSPRLLPDSSPTPPRRVAVSSLEGNGMETEGKGCVDARADFDEIKSAYPEFSGDQDWLNAEHHWNAQLERGESHEDILAGVRRYARYVAAGGASSPKFVTTPGKFLAGKKWAQEWKPPPSKAETRLSANISAAQEFMRRTEVPQ